MKENIYMMKLFYVCVPIVERWISVVYGIFHMKIKEHKALLQP